MKKILSRIGSIGLSTLLFVTSCTPVLASDIKEITETSNQSVNVDYSQSSSFTVSIPKSITITDNKTAEYDISVSGDIYGDSVVSVDPSNTIVMKDSHGKENTSAKVTQEKTIFTSSEIENSKSVKGSISDDNLSAGVWSGSLKFDINLLEPGLYQEENETKTLVKTWDELISDNLITINPDTMEITGNNLSGYTDCTLIIAGGIKGFETKQEKLPNSYIPTNIGCFRNCTALKEVIIPEGVTSINKNTFEGCSLLVNVYLPQSLITIDSNAFFRTGIENINIPENVENINMQCFSNCQSLKSVNIENPDTIINDRAFNYCINLVDINLPQNLTIINNNVFSYCESLENIIIPSSVTEIGSYAFSDCTKLDITIPDTVTSIDATSFNDVKHITYNGTATGSPWGAKSVN